VSLTEKQIERYSRHIILEQVGGGGQEKLLSSKVLMAPRPVYTLPPLGSEQLGLSIPIRSI